MDSKKEKSKNTIDLMETVEEEKMKGMALHSTMMELYNKNNVELAKLKMFEKLIKLQKQMLGIIEKKRKSDFRGPQVIAQYRNYNDAVDRLWRYFRHDYSDPDSNIDLQTVLEKQKVINDCINKCIIFIKVISSKP